MRRLEEQFVVNLENHSRFEFLFREFAGDFDHSEFDQIGGGALQGRVERGALGKIAHVDLLRCDFGDGADAAEERAGHAGFARLVQGFFQVFFYAAIASEIGVDEFRGFFRVDTELRGQAERRLAVDNSKINGLGGAAVRGVLRHGADAENFLRGARVDVLPGLERFDQHRVLGKMRQDAQLDLRIIGREQRIAGASGKRGANLAAEFSAYGNVLQVRVGGTQTSRGRAGLAEAGVQASGFGVN